MDIRSPKDAAEFEEYLALRWQVLRAPWGQPRGTERDELEETAEHAMLVGDNGEPLAVGRLHFNTPHEAQIRYMAVAPEVQGQGLGRRIVEHLEAVARQRGASTIVLNARDEVTAFYARLGYRVVGEGPTMFGTVAHAKMSKDLGQLG